MPRGVPVVLLTLRASTGLQAFLPTDSCCLVRCSFPCPTDYFGPARRLLGLLLVLIALFTFPDSVTVVASTRFEVRSVPGIGVSWEAAATRCGVRGEPPLCRGEAPEALYWVGAPSPT